jgi:hypothetical protein
MPDPSVGDTFFLLPSGPLDLNESASLVMGPTSKAQCTNGCWQSFEWG